MRFALELSLGGPHARTIRSLSAAGTFNAADGLVTLPPWLTITCATTGRTSQQSASTLKKGYGANAARARNTGTGVGLSVENAGANYLTFSESLAGADWTAGVMTVTTGHADPAGGSLARGFTQTGSQYGDYNQEPLSAPPDETRSVSGWCRGVAGLAPYAHFRGYQLVANYADVMSTSWTRLSVTEDANVAAGGLNVMNFDTRAGEPTGAPAIAGTTTVHGYGWQKEGANVLYPSSWIPTTTDAVTRAADVLSCASSALSAGGFFDVAAVIAPNYADFETKADHDLLFFDADNRLYFKQSDRKLYHHFGGTVDIVSGALTFARDTGLAIRAQYRPSGRRLLVANAATGVVLFDSGVTSAGTSISLPATAYLLGDDSGAQECSDLRSISVYRP